MSNKYTYGHNNGLRVLFVNIYLKVVKTLSVLEEIKEAEAESAKTKQEAVVEARNILRIAEEKANAKAKEMIEVARKNAKATVKAAEDKARFEAQEVISQKERENRTIAYQAKNKLPEAVQYIVEKVVV